MDSSKQPIARCGRWATPRRFASPTLSLAVATTPGCAPAQRRLLRSLPSEHHRRRQQQRQREPLAPRLAPPPGGVGRQSRLSRSRSSQGTGRGGLTPPLCRVGSGRMPPDPRPAGAIHHSTHAPPAAYLPCYLLGSRSIIVVMTVILVVVQCTIISITYSSGVEYLLVPAVHLYCVHRDGYPAGTCNLELTRFAPAITPRGYSHGSVRVTPRSSSTVHEDMRGRYCSVQNRRL